MEGKEHLVFRPFFFGNLVYGFFFQNKWVGGRKKTINIFFLIYKIIESEAKKKKKKTKSRRGNFRFFINYQYFFLFFLF